MPVRQPPSRYISITTDDKTITLTGGLDADPRLTSYFQQVQEGYDTAPKTRIELNEQFDDSKAAMNFPWTGGPQYGVNSVKLEPHMHYPGYFQQPVEPAGAVMVSGDYGIDPSNINTAHLVIRRNLPTFSKHFESHIATLNDQFDLSEEYEHSAYPFETLPGSNAPLSAVYLYPYRSTLLYQFRGSVTHINPEHDQEKADIINYGLEYSDKVRAGKTVNSYGVETPTKSVQALTTAMAEREASPETPTTPIHPFTRVYPQRARTALMNSYNRTKLPIADIEFRKAFRHIFITRPECYLMAIGDTPSIQVLNDEDMSACWSRYPHVIRALSPVYVEPSPSIPKYANWNWLLCNRVQGLTTGSNTLNLVDSVTKSIHGATVTPGKNLTTLNGASLELSFRDTRYFDVYEMLRIWMMYIHKRRMGSFFPSYNGYHLQNDFVASAGGNNKLPVGTQNYHGYNYLHPYDRALDYCASLYDIVTDETGSKILYWCKYYGIYPVNVANGALSNDGNAALTGEAKITATFQYQYKRENIFKNLVEFNFNAGICDNIGNMRDDVSMYLRDSLSYLNREKDVGGTTYTNSILHNYDGASSMFTGSPYIITEYSGLYDPWDFHSANKMIDARLGFVPIHYGNELINDTMNLGISNEEIPSTERRQTMVLQSNRV